MKDGQKSTFLSYGAGMQTFALLVMAEKGEIQIDEVVFADTGMEHPETYDHIERVAKPLCERIGVPFTIVRMSKEISDVEKLTGNDLLDYKTMLKDTEDMSRNKKIAFRRKWEEARGIPRIVVHDLGSEIAKRRRLPSVNPKSRWCTGDSKLIPIISYIRSEQTLGKYVKPAAGIIGLSYEEMLRQYIPHEKEYSVNYPLIEKKMTRDDCIRYVSEAGYDVPPKSGCYLCPFQGKKQWTQLLRKHPDLYDEAVRLEEADLNFPTYKLLPNGDLTLRTFRERVGPQFYFTAGGEGENGMSCPQANYCGI